MSNLGTLSLGLVLAAPLAAQDRPAVRMMPAKPMEAVDTIIARAAPDSGFDPFHQTPRNDQPRLRSMFEAKTDREAPTTETPWKKFSKWMDDRAQAVKKAVSAPTEPQPEPRVGQPQARKLFQPQQPPVNEPRKVNAADPAYRWYGYGTVTPGANQFAPTGEYPHGSSQWYTQTGATPGAFPVPTMNPYRPVPGTSPPVYVPSPAPTTSMVVPPPAAPVIAPPTIAVSPPAPSFTPPPVRRTIAETPAVEPPKVAPAMPPVIGPSNQVPVPPPANIQSKVKYEPKWIPMSAEEVQKSEPVIIPVIRGQAPAIDDSPLAREIQSACRGLARNVVVQEVGPQRLVISFTATTQSLADLAVAATSKIGALKPYDVQFAAKVSQ